MQTNFQVFLSTLPVVGYGMGGVFLVILLIMGVTWLFNKVTSGRDE